MSKRQSFLYGFFIGGIVAGAAAILSNPMKSKDIKTRVCQNIRNLENVLGELKNEGVSLKQQIAQSAKESMEIFKEVAQDLNKSFQTWQMEIEPNKKELEKKVKEIEEKLKELEKSSNKQEP